MENYRMPRPADIEEEQIRIMDAYCALDPDGDFDEDEWKKFYNEHASEKLKRYDRKVKAIMKWAKENNMRV